MKHGAAPAAPPVETAPARGNEVILLVDDEEGVRSLCGSALQELGYTVLEAASGEQAVSILQSQGDRVALLLTDVAMPGMGGLALGRWAAAHLPALPVGYLSGFLLGSEDDLARLDQSRLLIKPFRLEALAEMARRLLDTRPVARSAVS
jgi:CheY-like chemotaxis protein